MASGTIQAQTVEVFNFGAGATGITAFGHGVFDRNTGMVRLYLTARNTSADITGADTLATIPAGYRPKYNLNRATCMCRTNNGTVAAYHATILSTGEIRQDLGSTIREVFLVYEYSIN